MKQFFVLTLFPEMIQQTLSHSIMGRAQKEGHISVEAINIRDYTLNKHSGRFRSHRGRAGGNHHH